jgi:hypothetical protein
MLDPRVALRVGLLVAAAVALAFAAVQVREKRSLALAAVDDIERQLASLDPATRAAVITRMSADGAKKMHDLHGKP